MADKNTTAWGDESVRLLAEKPMYLIAACVLPEDPKAALAKIAKLMPMNAKKVHWRDMGIKDQKRSLEILSEISHSTYIVVAAPLNGRKQERARRKCLETLLPWLEHEGVSVLVLESRGEHADKKDIDFLLYLRRSQIVESIDLEHADGRAEDHLCIPDQILGAYGEITIAKTRSHAWEPHWEKVARSVRIFEVDL